ncbi:MAG: hypothetical protein ACOYJV_08465 [Aminivibrio sp.]|jgi:hypothetical protein
MKIRKRTSIILAVAVLLIAAFASGALAAVADYIREGAFGKFSEEAREAVKKNTEVFRNNLAYTIGKSTPIARFFSDAKSYTPILLSHMSSFQSLKGSRETGLEEFIKLYDNMIITRMDFFIKSEEVMREPFRSKKVVLYDALEFWGKHENKFKGMGNNQRQGAGAIKEVKHDYDDLRNRISQPGPQALSSNSKIKELFIKKIIKWPPRRNEMEKLKLNNIYRLPWLNDYLDLEYNTKKDLEMMDRYVEGTLKEFPKILNDYVRVMRTAEEYNNRCGNQGQRVKSAIQGNSDTKFLLPFGLREAMIDAADLEIMLYKHHYEELKGAKDVYNSFVKFYESSDIRDLSRYQYGTYINSRGSKENSMLKAMESYSREMKEYLKKFRDMGM